MLRTLATTLSVACLLLAAGAFAVAQATDQLPMLPPASGQLTILRLYQTADGVPVVQLDAPTLSVKPYHVSDAIAFRLLALPLPARGFVFRNGLYQTPGIDYDPISAGAALRFRAGVLAAGDTVTLVSLRP